MKDVMKEEAYRLPLMGTFQTILIHIDSKLRHNQICKLCLIKSVNLIIE
jgi:hypothetical protein